MAPGAGSAHGVQDNPGKRIAQSILRITIALAGQAERNSTDWRRLAGTSERSTVENPNRGKKRSAVVVSRKSAGTPAALAAVIAASVMR